MLKQSILFSQLLSMSIAGYLLLPDIMRMITIFAVVIASVVFKKLIGTKYFATMILIEFSALLLTMSQYYFLFRSQICVNFSIVHFNPILNNLDLITMSFMSLTAAIVICFEYYIGDKIENKFKIRRRLIGIY